MSTTTTLGKVCVTPKGAWNSGTAYDLLDIVTNGGGAYLAKQNVPAGTQLSNQTYWLQITQKGNTGDAAGFATPTATANTLPAGSSATAAVSASGAATSKQFDFTFGIPTGATGNGIASINKTSTVGNVDTYTITMTNGTTTTFTVTNGSVSSVDGMTGDVVLSNKANINGYYSEMTVGAAEQVVSPDGVTQSNAGFYFRTSGGDVSISDGTASIEKMYGRTIVWNQLVQNGNFESTTGWSHITSVSSNVATFTPSGAYASLERTNKDVTIKLGHKYLVSVSVKAGESTGTTGWKIAIGNINNSDFIDISLTISTSDWTRNNNIITFKSSVTSLANAQNVHIYKTNATDIGTIYVQNFMLIDLTQMFGAGNEPTTVNQFRDLFPLNYYAYDAGSLLSFNPSGIKTVGFNQWDEEWELGDLSVDGQPSVASNKIRSKNYIPVFPNTQYYVKAPVGLWIHQYSANNEHIGVYNTAIINAVITTPSNCAFLKFTTSGTQTSTYNHDICINLSHSGYRNGEYEPYASFTRPIDLSTIQYQGSALFPNGLCSAGSAKDEVTSGKAIKRVGAVDLGSLTWAAGPGNSWTTTGLSNLIKRGLNDNQVYPFGIQCDTIPLIRKNTSDIWITNTIAVSTSGQVYINNGSTTNRPTGTLFYELATPIEVDLDPKLNLTYTVWDFGTEQLLPVNDDEPTTSKTDFDLKYLDNLRDKLRKDVVTYTAQNESAARKAQARQNIGAEAVSNKVTSISDQSTDDQYPSAKCVYDETNQIKEDLVDEATALTNALAVQTRINTKQSREIANLKQQAPADTVVNYPDTTYGKGEVPTSVCKYAEVNKINGCSRVWNQLANNGEPPYARQGLTFTANVDGTFTIDGTATATSSATGWFGISDSTGKSGHKIFQSMKLVSGTVTGTLRFAYARDYCTMVGLGDESIVTLSGGSSTQSGWSALTFYEGDIFTNAKIRIQVFDLTLLYGSGSEPTTVAQFKADYPLPYYAYNAGEIKSSTLTAFNSRGVNIWDEEWEVGGIDPTTGQNAEESIRIRSKNYIKVLPNTTYYITSIQWQYLLAYDASKTYIGTISSSTDYHSFTTNANQCYFRFCCESTYGTTYNHDIQICLNSVSTKTTYHPYNAHSTNLPQAITLKSAGTAKDEYMPSTGAVTRNIGMVDMGTMNWILDDRFTYHQFYASNPSNMVSNGMILCGKYNYSSTHSWLRPTDKTIGTAENYIIVSDNNYTDAAAFKASLSGVYLYYELASSTSESVTPIDDFIEVEAEGEMSLTHTETPAMDSRFTVTYANLS